MSVLGNVRNRRGLPAATLIGPCIEWTGAKDKKGYGYARRNNPRRVVLVHREALAAKLGRPIRAEHCALHYCDNPPCFNPDHLWEGTKADNNADMKAKGRRNDMAPQTVCNRGHELTEFITKTGKVKRRCLPCGAERQRRYRGGDAQ